jgi:hypothetical protein
MIKDIRNHFASKFEERIKQEAELQAQRLSDNEERIARERLRRNRLNAEAQQRKENDEWNPENTDALGLAANALKEWLIDEGDWDGATKEEVQHEIDELREMMDQDPEVIADPSGERAQEYGEDLNNLEEDLENAESVYDIIPTYDYYGMYEFEYGGAEYAVGDDDAADEAAFERTKSLIDDIGYEGFNPSFMEWHIDGDALADYMEDWFYDDMNEAPEDYLDFANDTELSKEAENNIDLLDELIGEFNEELEESDNERDEEELLAKIEDLEIEKEEISEDEANWEYTEEAKDEYVERRMDEVKDDPMNALRDFGMEDRVADFIDEDSFIEDVISTDGRGHTLSSYDGDENEVIYRDEWYYIYRTN